MYFLFRNSDKILNTKEILHQKLQETLKIESEFIRNSNTPEFIQKNQKVYILKYFFIAEYTKRAMSEFRKMKSEYKIWKYYEKAQMPLIEIFSLNEAE